MHRRRKEVFMALKGFKNVHVTRFQELVTNLYSHRPQKRLGNGKAPHNRLNILVFCPWAPSP